VPAWPLLWTLRPLDLGQLATTSTGGKLLGEVAAMSAKGHPAPPVLVPAMGLTVQDAAAALSLGYDIFHRDVEPQLKIVRLGRRKIVPVAELQRWLDENAERTL
jgi:hypothetical protein